MARPKGHRINPAALTDLLKIRGLSLQELSERSEVPRPTISSLRGGFHNASTPTAHRIALALDCQPQTLFPTMGATFAAIELDEEGAA